VPGLDPARDLTVVVAAPEQVRLASSVTSMASDQTPDCAWFDNEPRLDPRLALCQREQRDRERAERTCTMAGLL